MYRLYNALLSLLIREFRTSRIAPEFYLSELDFIILVIYKHYLVSLSMITLGLIRKYGWIEEMIDSIFFYF